MKARTANTLKKVNNEISVDTVKASIDAYVFFDGGNGWEHNTKGKRWFYFKEVKKNGQSVRFYFYADPGQNGIDPKTGKIFIEFSLPKFLYGNNISGVLISDKERLFSEVKDLLSANHIYIDGAGDTRDYRNFDVKKVDYSVSFDAISKKEKDEYFRIFRKMHFPYHDVGKLNGKDYDYDSSFCHGSNSTDIVLYDKTEEIKEYDGEDIKDNICRLEIRCKKPINDYKDFGLVKNLFEKGNTRLIKVLKNFRLDLDILPKEEYWQTIRTYLEEKKAAYKADKNKSPTNYPSYLSANVDKIYGHLEYTNTYGEEAALIENYKLHKKCLELTDELKISILYNDLDKRMNILSRIYQHNDLPEVFGIDDKEKQLYANIENEEATNATNTEYVSYGWKRKTKSRRYGFRLGLDPFGWSGKTYNIGPDYRVLFQSLQGFENLVKPLYHRRE